ncbi:Response regulator mcs4 [Lachnellula hyalina]|uniref:Response regulator mcs4 n=1 Tax=Lachnellula hyalina TaxID=1316788 RepID=A0A8H8R9U6_9HELO|nr:Response regulator mcs4 [Lachnellula hyalina]TVY30633.1 Response regulator mcs4 [Lachnellula hyalina]
MGGDLKNRLKFWRRASATSSLASLESTGTPEKPQTPTRGQAPRPQTARVHIDIDSPSLPPLRGFMVPEKQEEETNNGGRRGGSGSEAATGKSWSSLEADVPASDAVLVTTLQSSDLRHQTTSEASKHQDNSDNKINKHDSTSTADFPTPNTDCPTVPEEQLLEVEVGISVGAQFSDPAPTSSSNNNKNSKLQRPAELPRRQSLLAPGQTQLINTLLEIPAQSQAATLDSFTKNSPTTGSANTMSRKIWVKRPGASATLVTIHEDDLVDDVRDMILRKYANSLGRNFDAPDVTLRVVPREQRQERTLGPEESMAKMLDTYYPGGQAVGEALIIDVPLRRTPKPSPQPCRSYYEDGRPLEGGSDYFPPMPVPIIPSPHLQNAVPVNGQQNGHHLALTQHSMPGTGPPITRREQTTTSPRATTNRTNAYRVPDNSTVPSTAFTTTSRHQWYATVPPSFPLPNSLQYVRTQRRPSTTHGAPLSQPLQHPPQQDPSLPIPLQIQRTITPPPRVSSPRPVASRPKKYKKANNDHPSLPAGMLNGGVPPINVLIVEDNIINLKLLEAFMKRLKVRWQTAMNGKEAVTKWRAGGFHLVLMDIQLPIMSGLEATKEIRRLERLNSIGVFSSSASSSAPNGKGGEEVVAEGEDRLPSSVLFKSPVIIVALTASSLQSDRHEALAAGCNDFLTKPVNFVWLERKVMEWGCMQALIDFDGWRKWKDFSQIQADGEGGDGGEKKKKGAGGRAGKKLARLSSGGGSSSGGGTLAVGGA